MSRSELRVLLQRFGLEEGAKAHDLRAAYLHGARRLHPDVGGRGHRGLDDGAAFVRWKQDHDRAQALLAQLPRPGASRPAPPAGFRRAADVSWGASAGMRSPPRPYNTSPPAPPASVVWLFRAGATLSLGMALRGLVAPSAPAPREAATGIVLATGEAVATRQRVDVGVRRVQSTPPSEYYKKRSKTAEESATLKARPHCKMRGSTYISPIHSAAEDGLAEWLHWAGERSSTSLRESLDKNRQTPLHYAARAGQHESCAVLLKYKASPLATDAGGRTPLDLARHGGHDDVVRMLEAGPPGPLAQVQFRKKPSLRSQNKGICG